MFGIFNINKPAGCTSRDVVNRVQRLMRPAKVGHAGTLDPIATGVLVVCVGPATRLIEYVQQMPKRYRGTFRLGCQSPTDDIEGEVTPWHDATQPTRNAVEAALPQFIGEISQQPPAYSAIKVNGKRAYQLARQGKVVELASRPVTIYSLAIHRYEYPELVLDIECGSGTYVRSLGRDLAEALGTRAVMSGLVRTAIGEFQVDSAVVPNDLTKENIACQMLSPLMALPSMPRQVLTTDEIDSVRHGRFISIGSISPDYVSPESISPEVSSVNLAATDPDGQLVAILSPKPNGQWGPLRNFRLSEEVQ